VTLPPQATTSSRAASSGPAPAPMAQLDDVAIADLELVLDGVRLPWAVLGDRWADATAPKTAADHAVGVRVAADVAVRALDVGALLVVDREGTPVARFASLTAAEATFPPHSSPVVLCGVPSRVRRRESSLLARRAARPDELSPPAGPRVVVLAARPPLAGELSRLTRESAAAGGEPTELVVLVPAEQPTADGVDPVRLLRCTDLAAAADAPDAVVLPVPACWRDPVSDEHLVRALGEAYGAQRAVLLGDHPSWTALVAAARAGRPLPAVADESVLVALTGWGAPRSRRGLVVMLTGLSGSGKSTIARDLAHYVMATTDRTVSLLDGDDVRRLLSSGLGFDHASRDLNVRRIAYVAAEVARHGGIAVCAPIAPYRESRAAARAMVTAVGDFVLVHVATPLEECERRDLKGLYARARSGELDQFTGISDPYEEPDDADVVVDTTGISRERALQVVVDHLVQQGWLPGPAVR
jgi:sulfate adenylyltransferase